MALNIKIDVQANGTIQQLQLLNNAIRNEVTTAISTSVDKVHDTINTDYRRSGSATPSYQNPSRSGLGFTDRTGRLRSSIQHWVEEQGYKTVGYVSAGVPYDVYVELLWGGQYSFMLPALVQNHSFITNKVEDAVRRAVNRL